MTHPALYCLFAPAAALSVLGAIALGLGLCRAAARPSPTIVINQEER